MKPGERLQFLRQAKGLNKNQFHDLVNELGEHISSGYLSNLESGKANSERVGIHYLRIFARALEVRQHVMTSEIRDAEIEKNAGQVLEEEVLEVFLERDGTGVEPRQAGILRSLVKSAGGPKWCREWPTFYKRLTTYSTLSKRSPSGNRTPPRRPAGSLRSSR